MLTFQDIANAISILYIGGFLIVLVLVLYFIKPVWGKALGALITLAAFVYPIAATVIPEQRAMKERIKFSNEAWDYFRKKCDADSGERISKTVDGVKSVLIVKPLPPAGPEAQLDQFWYGDPYSDPGFGQDRGAINAVHFLTETDKQGMITLHGFDFAEIRTEKAEGGVAYQRITRSSAVPWYKVQEIEKPVSRYGVTWEDISKPEDRKYWIAGSRLRVIDLNDNSLVLERIGYLIESGFGSRAGARTPWLTAARRGDTSCPRTSDTADRKLILKVLKPTKENQNAK